MKVSWLLGSLEDAHRMPQHPVPNRMAQVQRLTAFSAQEISPAYAHPAWSCFSIFFLSLPSRAR